MIRIILYIWDLMFVVEKKWFKWLLCVIYICRYEGLYSFLKVLWILKNYLFWVMVWERIIGIENL